MERVPKPYSPFTALRDSVADDCCSASDEQALNVAVVASMAARAEKLNKIFFITFVVLSSTLFIFIYESIFML